MSKSRTDSGSAHAFERDTRTARTRPTSDNIYIRAMMNRSSQPFFHIVHQETKRRKTQRYERTIPHSKQLNRAPRDTTRTIDTYTPAPNTVQHMCLQKRQAPACNPIVMSLLLAHRVLPRPPAPVPGAATPLP